MSKNPTISQLVAHALTLNAALTEDVAKAKINVAKARSFKKVAELFTKKSRAGQIRSERVIEPGPRGFRFGDVWNQSVKTGTGIAVHPTYMPKLVAQAEQLGVKVPANAPQTKIAEAVAAVL